MITFMDEIGDDGDGGKIPLGAPVYEGDFVEDGERQRPGSPRQWKFPKEPLWREGDVGWLKLDEGRASKGPPGGAPRALMGDFIGNQSM